MVAALIIAAPSAGVARNLDASAQAFAAKGEELADQGAFDLAVDRWKSARDAFRREGREPELTEALIQLAAAYHALGQQRLALESIKEAVALARAAKDLPRLASALSSLGAMQAYSRGADDVEKNLGEALRLARSGKDSRTTASVLNNLGNLAAAQGKYDAATQHYREAIGLAGRAGDKSLAATGRANLADATARSGNFVGAAALTSEAVKAATALPDSHQKAFCLLRAGKTWEWLFENEPSHLPKQRLAAMRAYEAAAVTATALGDDRALSLSLGYTGHLYEQEKKMDEALRLTARATFLAQRLRSPDILYQWEWQTGRILQAQGRIGDAIDAHRRAVDSLEKIRSDLSVRLGNSNARSSFREAVGEVYFGLADLLLVRADGVKDREESEKNLREARDVCEQLKTVELEDYFQDDCVNLLKKKKENVEDILRGDTAGKGGSRGQNTAVIYFVPLRDRIETIVSLPDGLHRVKVPVGSEQLTFVAREFRLNLEKRTTNEYLAGAWLLYDWLIRPLEPLLTAGKIDTLVFIPDGALRAVPMAAFHDRRQFLIEKYAIAVSPGLTLMEPRAMDQTTATLMASGLSESVQGFPALPAVVAEMKQLDERMKTRTFMNRDFLKADVEKEFKSKDYSVVHIASHGEFSGDVRKTFVLTYDSRMNLDEMEKMIRPAQLRDKPVEMLSLSACQTAAGDDRAALGLAGVAVKAGARSAFATLWCVNDEASAKLIADFYGELFGRNYSSKAKALRKAQLNLLGDPRYSHPCLWAPYLIIGNWL